MQSMSVRNFQKGFTLVEVAVVAPMIMLLIGAFIGAIVFLTSEVMVARTSNAMMYDVQDALDLIEQDVRLSGAFLAQSKVVPSPQGVSRNATRWQNVQTVASQQQEHLVLNVIATTHGSSNPARQPVYQENEPYACGHESVLQNRVATLNVVYFVRDNALWRRVVFPTPANNNFCDSPWQQPSCAEVNLNHARCQAIDMRLIDGISPGDFTVRYYNTPGAANPNSTAHNRNAAIATRQAALSSTSTVQVEITNSRHIAGRDVEQSGVVRATRVGARIEY